MFADDQLRRSVLEAFTRHRLEGSDHIGVTTRAGVVTLTGYVVNCGHRDAACRVARAVGGVDDLINSVLIAVPSSPEAAGAGR